jgi:hypothetical protein
MKFVNATNTNRKSGAAEWRDLWFLLGFSHTPALRGIRFKVEQWKTQTEPTPQESPRTVCHPAGR